MHSQRPPSQVQNSTTSFLTATTLIYAIGAGITAAAGHLLLPTQGRPAFPPATFTIIKYGPHLFFAFALQALQQVAEFPQGLARPLSKEDVRAGGGGTRVQRGYKKSFFFLFFFPPLFFFVPFPNTLAVLISFADTFPRVTTVAVQSL